MGDTTRHLTLKRLYRRAAAPQPIANNTMLVDIWASRELDWLSVTVGPWILSARSIMTCVVVLVIMVEGGAVPALKGERRSYYPVIELAGQAYQNIGSLSSDGGPSSNINRPGQSIFLSFSVPLFDGGMRRNRISMADAKAREAQEQLAAARDSASQQVVRAYNGLVTSLAEYEAATVFSQAAHTAYDAALRSYRQGVGTYTDLATEENALVQGDTQVEDARANAHTAAAALALSMGAIDIAGSGGTP